MQVRAFASVSQMCSKPAVCCALLASSSGRRSGIVWAGMHVAGSVLWAAHAGDSRAVLARGVRAVRLTEDHKPCLPAERMRVEANGGRVQLGRGQRCWCAPDLALCCGPA